MIGCGCVGSISALVASNTSIYELIFVATADQLFESPFSPEFLLCQSCLHPSSIPWATSYSAMIQTSHLSSHHPASDSDGLPTYEVLYRDHR
jgi:hypothetical protein